MAYTDKITWNRGMFGPFGNIECGYLGVGTTKKPLMVYGADTDPNGIGLNYIFRINNVTFIILAVYNPTEKDYSSFGASIPAKYQYSNLSYYTYLNNSSSNILVTAKAIEINNPVRSHEYLYLAGTYSWPSY